MLTVERQHCRISIDARPRCPNLPNVHLWSISTSCSTHFLSHSSQLAAEGNPIYGSPPSVYALSKRKRRLLAFRKTLETESLKHESSPKCMAKVMKVSQLKSDAPSSQDQVASRQEAQLYPGRMRRGRKPHCTLAECGKAKRPHYSDSKGYCLSNPWQECLTDPLQDFIKAYWVILVKKTLFSQEAVVDIDGLPTFSEAISGSQPKEI